MPDPDELFQQAARLPLLNHDQEKALAARIHGDDPADARRARNTLVRHNIRLAYKNAAYYAKRNTHVQRDDMIQAGIEGLIRAAEKYDPGNHGTRFSTYATIWVKQKIVRFIEETHSRLCRVPNHVTADFINQRMTEEERDHYRRNHLNTISTDAPNHNSEGTTIGETVRDTSPGPEAINDLLTHRNDLQQIMGRAPLTGQETAVLIYAFGLGGAREMKIGEMAEMFGTTSARMSAIKTSALNKLREVLHEPPNRHP